jgi:hypothetical protein
MYTSYVFLGERTKALNSIKKSSGFRRLKHKKNFSVSYRCGYDILQYHIYLTWLQFNAAMLLNGEILGVRYVGTLISNNAHHCRTRLHDFAVLRSKCSNSYCVATADDSEVNRKNC